MNVYAADGTFLFDAPSPGRGARLGHLSQPRDVDVDSTTGDVWVVDGWNQRVQRFGPDGAGLGAWGHRSGSAPYGFNYPRGIGIDPATGNVWVSNERGHYIRVFDPTMSSVRFQIGAPAYDDTGEGHLRWPNDVEFWNGRAIVADRTSKLVKVFDAATGTQLSSISRANHGIAVNPDNGDIYVADPATDVIYQYSSAGSLIRSWGSTGNGPGQFRFAWDLVVHDGTLYVADSDLSRIQAFSLTGELVGSWGGYGTGAYEFKNPSGLAVDEATGRLYVADAGNNRIQVFDLTSPRPPYEWSKPTVAVASPVDGTVLADAGQLVVSGTAADDQAVARVGVAVQDTATGLWWRSADSSWQPTRTWGTAAWQGTGTTAVAWSFPVNGLAPGGAYVVEATVVDHWGNASVATPSAGFTVLAGLADAADPATTVAVPTASQAFPANAPLAFSGQATDDVGVAAVQVAIGSGGRWLQPDGTMAARFAWHGPAALAAPGAPSTGWTFDRPALAPGQYSLVARAVDLAGKVDLARPLVAFSVLAADTTAPTGALVSPAAGGTVTDPAGPLTIAGTVADDHAVASVEVAVKDTMSGRWLRADGTWAPTFAWLPAAVAAPGTASTTWSTVLPAPSTQAYGVQARATDAAGNTAVIRWYATFTVVPAGPVDTAPPGGSLTSPQPGTTVPGPVTVTGTATDDVAVAAVDVGIRNVATGRWLQADGSWAPTFAWVATTLEAPGTSATGWSYLLQAPNAGTYGVQARARDAVGTTTTIRSYATFTVA